MSTNIPKRFLHKAHAVGLVGRLDLPQPDFFGGHATVYLPLIGGQHSASLLNFNYKEMFKIDNISTQVNGSFHTGEKAYHNQSHCELTGVNLLHQVTADRMAVWVSTKHPDDLSQQPQIQVFGTAFQGVTLGGYPATVELDLASFNTLDTYDKLYNKLETVPAFFKQAMPDQTSLPARGQMLLCTIVKQITVPAGSGITVGGNHAFIPHFGTIYFAEIYVETHSRRLTAFRAELGCPASGTLVGGDSGSNGGGYPPA